MFNSSGVVGIVGAGPAGLGVAAELLDAGFEIAVFERHGDVGGVWDIDNPGSPMYESAHLISSRSRSGFRGFPMPTHYPDYPTREQQLSYLRDFARAKGLYEHIRFNTEVTDAQRTGGGGWTLRLNNGEAMSVQALVVANGHLWTPRIPDYPGDFSGTALHAVDYRSPEQLAGRRVLIVGGGNSAVDIACDAARSARSASISMRRGYHLIPKHIFGIPTDVFGHTGPPLPARIQQAMFGALVRMLVGDLRRYGLQAPDHPIMASHPIMNDQIVHHLRHGDIDVKPDISEINGRTVRFVDSSCADYDTIIWATGYHIDIPFLAPSMLPTRDGVPDLYLRLMHRQHDDIFFPGLIEVDASINPTLSRQGQLIVAALHARHTRGLHALKQTDPEMMGRISHLNTERHHIYIQEQAYASAARDALQRLQRLADQPPVLITQQAAS